MKYISSPLSRRAVRFGGLFICIGFGMEKEIKIFEKSEIGSVRTVIDENNNPWFCLPDVCKILEISDVKQLKRRLDGDGMQLIDAHAGFFTLRPFSKNFNGNTMTTFVNEKNLYKSILKSNKPKAKAFEDWITGEILPSIRRTGKYEIINSNMPSIPKNYPEALRAYANQLVLLAEKEEENQKLIEEAKIMKPKVAIYEEVMSTEGLTGIRDTAFKLGFKQGEFVSMCISAGLFYRTTRNGLRAYNKFIEYFKLVQLKSKNGLPYNRLMITNRGTEFLIHRFKLNNIVPLPIDTNEPDMGIEVIE